MEVQVAIYSYLMLKHCQMWSEMCANINLVCVVRQIRYIALQIDLECLVIIPPGGIPSCNIVNYLSKD